jgi:hypothetical protein
MGMHVHAEGVFCAVSGAALEFGKILCILIIHHSSSWAEEIIGGYITKGLYEQPQNAML